MSDALLAREFSRLLGEDAVKTDEPMSAHTSFRIGGPADYLLRPSSGRELQELVLLCRERNLPYFIMGNGSNLLVSDAGFRGAVIRLGKNLSGIKIDGERIHAQCGALLSTIAAAAMNDSLAGFEFAGGIPGSLGGACVMNAGAYGGEMKQVLERVTVLDESGQICELAAGELELGYRSSVFQKRPLIALDAWIRLRRGERSEIEELSQDLRTRRQEKQPLDLPSAGSTFKRPEGYFAGKLIMEAGLRGAGVGKAMVSEKHCGFIVNAGGATAEDVISLIHLVREKVFMQFGVQLEPEIRMLGFDPSDAGRKDSL